MFGHTEIIIIAGVVLVLFGSKAIPKFFRAIGNARQEFGRGAAEAGVKEEVAIEDQTEKHAG